MGSTPKNSAHELGAQEMGGSSTQGEGEVHRGEEAVNVIQEENMREGREQCPQGKGAWKRPPGEVHKGRDSSAQGEGAWEKPW